MTYGTMADCYLAMGKKEERKKYLLLAMDVAQQTGSSQYLAMGYCNLIEGALNESDFTGAVKYGFAADSLLKKEPLPVQQMKLDSMMYVAYSNLSKPAEALARYQSFVRINNQVMSENQEALLNRIMVEYSVKEKNLMIEKQESDLRSKTMQLRLLVLLLAIAALFTGWLIILNNKLRKSRESLYRKEKYIDRHIVRQAVHKPAIATEPDALAEHSQKVLQDTTSGEPAVVDPELFEALYLRIISVLEEQQLYLDPELSVKTLSIWREPTKPILTRPSATIPQRISGD